MCATHNVTQSTLAVIKEELKRAAGIMEQIMAAKAPWSSLFVKQKFFPEGYKYYLAVVACGTTKEAQTIWSGLVESKVRLFVADVERQDDIELAHPFNKGFIRIHKCPDEDAVEKVKTGSFDYQIKETTTTDLSHPPVVPNVNEERESGEPASNSDKSIMVYNETFYIGLKLAEGKCLVQGLYTNGNTGNALLKHRINSTSPTALIY